MYIKFLDSKTPIECVVKPITPNIVELRFAGEIVENTSGFRAYLDKKCEYDIGGNSYIDFTTMYRNDESTISRNGYQLSNDGSVYVKPLHRVTFNASVGGSLDGDTVQEVCNYKDLAIPTPISDTDYEFTAWIPEIPAEGEIDANKSYTAIFTSTLPVPEPEPTLEDRVAILESDVKNINDALGGSQSE